MGKIRYILLALLSLLLLEGCVNTDLDREIEELSQGEIKLHISTPSTSVVGRRAGGGEGELTIHHGYIFVFSSEGKYKGFQQVLMEDIEENGSPYPMIKTKVEGYNSTSDKLIAVFNYCKRSFKGESDFGKMTKERVSDYFPLDKAYLDLLQEGLKNGTDTLGMPMFVNDFDYHSGQSVHEVYRSIAKISLFVKNTDVSTGLVGHTHSFTSENVRFTLVNSAESGEIGYASLNDVAGKVGGTTHQMGDTLNFDYRPTEYKGTENVTLIEEVESAIYLYEFPYSTKVITGDTLTQGVYDAERLSILIEHVDEVAHPGITFYYKLQLIDKEVNQYYDIKRNHDYRVVITDVYSDGYTDVEEAYLMPPSNIEYEIFDDKGDLTFSNGQYAISMDEVLNYESITIYGPDTTSLSFDNIRRILPPEVTNPLSKEEIEAMTNVVEFEVVNEEGISVRVTQNDFSDDGRLTDEGQSIKLELSGEGECTIKLKIKLGNLQMGFDEIKIKKIGSDLGGDSSFDAHPCQLRIENQYAILGTWNSKDSDFGVRNDGNDMIIYMGENATPVGYKTLDGYISSAVATNAYPYFEPKTREGYFSYYDLVNDPEKTTVKKSKIVLNQLAPFYVGHFGSKANEGPHYYNSLIVEKIEEIKDTHSYPHKDTGGLMNWSEQLNKVFYVKSLIYGSYLGLDKYLNFAEGRDISEYIVNHNATAGSLPLAARYCYMKNDIDGDGVIESNEPIVWYLPAANQLLAMWISKHLIDSEVDAKYFGFHLEHDNTPWYWTCSEVAPTEWDLGNFVFENNVARFNMLEGEMSVAGRKGMKGYDDLAHVRCVRGIVYDNSK